MQSPGGYNYVFVGGGGGGHEFSVMGFTEGYGKVPWKYIKV